MKALEERLTQMEEAFNTNTQAFSDGIQMMEAQQEVIRRAVTDLMHGRIRVLPEDCAAPQGPDEQAAFKSNHARVDWNGYLKEYIEELMAKEAAEKEHKANGAPVLATPDEDAPIIFGGDGT
jgi:hypothetical protein